MAADVSQPPSHPFKMSRYRSVRKAQLDNRVPAPAVPAVPVPANTAGEGNEIGGMVLSAQSQLQSQQQLQPQDQQLTPSPLSHQQQAPPATSNIGRSASRYRRAPKPRQDNGVPLPSIAKANSLPTIAQDEPLRYVDSASSRQTASPPRAGGVRQISPATPEKGGDVDAARRRYSQEQVEVLKNKVKEVELQALEREKERARAEAHAQREREAKEWRAREQASRDTERRKISGSAGRGDGAERVESRRQPVGDGDRVGREPPAQPVPRAASPTKQLLEKGRRLNFFGRRRDQSTSKSSPHLPPLRSTAERPRTSDGPPVKASMEIRDPPKMHKSYDQLRNFEAPTIKPGGGGIVPGVDAPQSAVNTGADRRVLVMCGKSSMKFGITPDTTALQLIRSASTCLSEQFDPRQSVISEVFTKANVQRPLRMYERVRDVMNSWDDDDQHALVIDPSTEEAGKELYVSLAPSEKPPGSTWTLYYSQKMGKWDKRTVTMNAEGQLTYAKGKDTLKICHLKESDIYTVIPKRLKKIKPPKKYSFAIKSQQRSSVFLDQNMYIHFFSTNDEKLFESFRRMVHDYRSWYLVHKLGEGKQAKVEPRVPSAPQTASTTPARGHSRTQSEDSHYILGTFNDLDFDPDEYRASKYERRDSVSSDTPLGVSFPGANEATKQMHQRRISTRTRSRPPVAYQTRLRGESVEPNPRAGGHSQSNSQSKSTSSNTFSPNGLLGNEYTERQRALDAAAAASNNPNGSPSGAMPTTSLQRTSSVRSSRSVHRTSAEMSNLARQDSTRRPKPLIDLTPAYRAPPQHAKKGKAFIPDSIGPGGLIDNATNPDGLPPAAGMVSIPPAQAVQAVPSAGGNIRRSTSVRRPADTTNPPLAYAPASSSAAEVPSARAGQAFTGGGLVASMLGGGRQGWGAGDRGHGVRRGADVDSRVRAGGEARPMLDLREEKLFVGGSLLDRR